jgi:hypothetical protein
VWSTAPIPLGSVEGCIMRHTQPKKHHPTHFHHSDWILFPDLVDKATVTCLQDETSDSANSSSKDEMQSNRFGNEDTHYTRFVPCSDLSSVQNDESDILSLLHDRRPSELRGEREDNAPPCRPSPQRLPTPDLPELDEDQLWECCNPFESILYHSKGKSDFLCDKCMLNKDGKQMRRRK